MQASCIVAVEVEGCPSEGPKFLWKPVCEVLVQDLSHCRIGLRGLGKVDVAQPIAQKPECVTPDPILSIRKDILPIRVSGKGPLPKGLSYLLLSDRTLLILSGLETLRGLPLRHQTVRSHQGGLPAAFPYEEVLVVETQVLRQLPPIPTVNGHVHVSECALVLHLRHIEGLIAEWTIDLDEASLEVPAPVGGPAAELERLLGRLRLRVLLVTDVTL
mmetsp:Transcript_67747/g.147560  ORF Transcript_67747/g.147560 Transcript_67747/m.147560 type:complete len:216 (-) Transcript_67747:347-994(-)